MVRVVFAGVCVVVVVTARPRVLVELGSVMVMADKSPIVTEARGALSAAAL